MKKKNREKEYTLEYLIKKEIKKYKKSRLKNLIIPGKNTTLDPDNERRNNGIHTYEELKVNDKVKDKVNDKLNDEIIKSPTIKHFEKIY